MIERQSATRFANAARLAVAGLFITGGALAMAGHAAADPEPFPPAPGEPVADAPVGPPAPPPPGPPMVPEIANQSYGSGSGPLGFLRDAWHQAQDPYGTADTPDGMPAAGVPPPGAGPAPKLPPGYTSLTDPSSSTPALPKDPNAVGPALPPGYYPLNGPPPPGYAPPAAPADPAAPPADPAAAPADAPVPPPTP
jgi:hypothetical protein